jgi:hypothetical protein
MRCKSAKYKGRGRVRTLIGPPLDFQKKAYPQMQNLMANLLVIKSTHFEKNFFDLWYRLLGYIFLLFSTQHLENRLLKATQSYSITNIK